MWSNYQPGMIIENIPSEHLLVQSTTETLEKGVKYVQS